MMKLIYPYKFFPSILLLLVILITGCTEEIAPTNVYIPDSENAPAIIPTVLSKTATSTLPSYKSAYLTAEARDNATQEVIQSTEEAMFPECQFVTSSTISRNRVWKQVHCINPSIGFYNLNSSQPYWFYTYDELAGKYFSDTIQNGYVHFLGWSDNEEYAYFSIFESGDGPCPLFYKASMIYRIDLTSGKLEELMPYGYYTYTFRQTFFMFVEQNDTKQIHLLNLDTLEITIYPIAETFDFVGFILWNDSMDQLIFLGKNEDGVGKVVYQLVLMDMQSGEQSVVYKGEIGYVPEEWVDSNQVRLIEGCSSKGYILNLDSPDDSIAEDILRNDIKNGSEFRSGQFHELSELSCEPSTNPYLEHLTPDDQYYQASLYPNIEITQACTFSGSIQRGEYYQQMILDDLRFCLVPGSFSRDNENEGWNIVISDLQEGACNIHSEAYANFGSTITPPFYSNLAFDIFGYHFRNSDNTGPNDGSINAPQEHHEFNFVFTREDHFLSWYQNRCNRWGMSEDCILATPPSEGYEMPRSRMTITITDIELGNLVPGEAAWIENMSFEGKLYLPADLP